MSKSRLEKFLYALYSLDSSDLPTPLSRIEELYKCLVTGEEAPTFKPISRVEKYLMVILGVYDVGLLPNPLSRVEVLLYKLATGDDSLEDFDTFLSEHEELLAEIIRNGGVGGNIDIEYVLYTLSTEHNTLYNTAEKPVKSAILKGQTLVNVHPTNYIVGGSNTTFFLSKIIPETMIKPNTRYFLRLYNTHQSIVRAYFRPCENSQVNLISSDNKCAIFTTKSEFTGNDFKNNKIHFYSSSVLDLEDVKDTKIILCEYVDGMENWDIPYFEGMQSVKMPVLKTVGKNLFDGEWEQGAIDQVTGELITSTNYRCKNKISVVPLSQIVSNANLNLMFYDENDLFVGYKFQSQGMTMQVPAGAVYMRFYRSVKIDGLQVEANTVTTTYEPYKSNILTVNEEVELRGIGDFKDELDLLTGELTQRIGEVVLDGSQDGGYDHAADESTGILTLRLPKIPDIKNTGGNILGLLSDKYASVTSKKPNNILSYNGRIMITKPISELESFNTADKIKSFLSQNPITVQYQLATESIKTVDLSVVDQDGNNVELSTFDDLTNVTLSSEELIPEAELEVATKNKEVLSTMSLEMNDISTTQNALQETSDIQSENVDATMIATTEIYEGLL